VKAKIQDCQFLTRPVARIWSWGAKGSRGGGGTKHNFKNLAKICMKNTSYAATDAWGPLPPLATGGQGLGNPVEISSERLCYVNVLSYTIYEKVKTLPTSPDQRIKLLRRYGKKTKDCSGIARASV
jgi:hypothetical protein